MRAICIGRYSFLYEDNALEMQWATESIVENRFFSETMEMI